jgi:hypothetical protein
LVWGQRETGGCDDAAGGLEREEDDRVAEAIGIAENQVLAWVAIADHDAVGGTGRGCDAEAEVGVLWGRRGG